MWVTAKIITIFIFYFLFFSFGHHINNQLTINISPPSMQQKYGMWLMVVSSHLTFT